MEPTIASATLRTALTVIKQLPRQANAKRVANEHRLIAYQNFSRAVWTAIETNSSAREIQPIAGKVFGGFWYHPMFVRTAERALMSTGELTGAYGGLRLVAPNVIIDTAERVANRIADLAAAPVGDSQEYTKRQQSIGEEMITFDLLCRIDLGIDRHPGAPKVKWYSPISWYKQVPWWLRARRGDWPALSATVAQHSDTMTKAISLYR